MIDPEELSMTDISGKLSGSIQWIKFDRKGSNYEAEGSKN